MEQTFEAWMEAVDEQGEGLGGCSVHDLPDCLFADWYADGVSPRSPQRRTTAMMNSDVEKAMSSGTEAGLLPAYQQRTEVRARPGGIYVLRVTRRGGGLTVGDEVRVRPAGL